MRPEKFSSSVIRLQSATEDVAIDARPIPGGSCRGQHGLVMRQPIGRRHVQRGVGAARVRIAGLAIELRAQRWASEPRYHFVPPRQLTLTPIRRPTANVKIAAA